MRIGIIASLEKNEEDTIKEILSKNAGQGEITK